MDARRCLVIGVVAVESGPQAKPAVGLALACSPSPPSPPPSRPPLLLPSLPSPFSVLDDGLFSKEGHHQGGGEAEYVPFHVWEEGS